MDYTVLFFLAILTTATQTTPLHHHCNSDVNSPASGMADLQQHTSLHYCLIDNCTIMRIDTGQQLEIIYTTQSLLVVTPKDGHTSMIISKSEPEPICSTPNTTTEDITITQVAGIIIVTAIGFVCGYIAVVHVIFKELRNTFGKLMLIYSAALVFQCIDVLALNITHHSIAVHSTMVCYLLNVLFMLLTVVSEVCATSFVAYLAYIMRLSCQVRQRTKEIDRRFFKYSVFHILGLSLLFGIFVVSYDFGTGTYEHTLLPNGHCSFLVQSEYNTIVANQTFIYINEFIQTLLLVAYFVYYFKLKKMLTLVPDMANTATRHDRLFLKIAITMGATLGISQVLLASSWYFDTEITLRIAGFFFFIQQCVFMSFYMCTKRMSRLCKKKFRTTQTP